MDTDGPILVTGSRGLIGTALVAALRAAGRPVIGIDVRGARDQVGGAAGGTGSERSRASSGAPVSSSAVIAKER